MNACATCNSSKCYDYCPKCKNGKVFGVALGMSMNGGFVPSYVEQQCSYCGGEGLIYCKYYSDGGNA